MSLSPSRDPYHAVPPRTERAGVVHAVVEIPKGRRSKFELDAATGLLRLDRYLAGSTRDPGDYGFVPGTLAEDGLFQRVDRGEPDHKLLAVPDTDPLFRKVHELADVAEAWQELEAAVARQAQGPSR